MELSKDIKITVVNATAAAAQTGIDSDILDMQGYEGVIFLALFGDVTTASVLTLTAKANTANHLTVPTPITQGATAAFTADGTSADSKVLMIDVYKPQLRYIFANLTRTAANAVVGGIIAIQYNSMNKPTTQHATVIASKFALGASA